MPFIYNSGLVSARTCVSVNTVYLRGSCCESVYLLPDELSRDVYIATGVQCALPEYVPWHTRTSNISSKYM